MVGACNPEIKDRYEICPECHRNTLLVHVTRKTGEIPPFKDEQWLQGDCQNCGYSRLLKQLEWDSIGDDSG